MLSMPRLIIAMHAVTIVVLALGLSGVSVGLGACMPNFRETDPSKIAVGFGGTLNLVACLLLLIVVIVLMAVPIHVVYAVHPERRAGHSTSSRAGSGWRTAWAWVSAWWRQCCRCVSERCSSGTWSFEDEGL